MDKNEVKVERFLQYRFFLIAIGFFLVSLFFSAIFSENPLNALKNDFFGIIRKMSIFFIMILFINGKKHAFLVLQCLILSLFITNLYAVYQGIYMHNFRVAALNGNCMWLGSFLASMLPVLLIIVLHRSEFLKSYWLYVSIFVLSIISMFFNGTRGVWLVMAILLPLLAFISIQNKRRFILFIATMGIICIGMYILVPHFYQRVNSITDRNNQSNMERIYLWKSSLNMALDHPFFGVGLGEFSKNYHERYMLPEAKEPHLEHAHNNFMHIMAENGFIGLSGFCFMFGSFLFDAWKEWRKKRSLYALMAVGATLGFLGHGLTEYNFTSSGSINFYWMLFGTCVILYKKETLEKSVK